VKKLLGLLVMSGAVLGALFLLANLMHMSGSQTTKRSLLNPPR
jgi:hypothetical protein